MFRSFMDQQQQSPSERRPSFPQMSTAPNRRSTLTHASTLSSLPSSPKPRPPPASSFFTSIFATLTQQPIPAGGTNLKSHRSEAELRRASLSPEREKEIGELWEVFKRQSGEIQDDKLTSFPCISEYEYEDEEEAAREGATTTSPRRIAA